MKKNVSTKSVFKALRKIQNDVSHIHDMNLGGCGVFAYIVGEELKKIGWEVEIVTPSYGGIPSKVRRHVKNNSPEEWSNNGLSRNHLAVRFKTPKGVVYTYDSDRLDKGGSKFGWFEYDCEYPFGEGLTVEETKEMCKTGKGWNRTFNRKQIPEIRSTIKKSFKEIITK